MEALMKKTDELSLEKTLAFAAQCYVDKKTNTGVEMFPFCKQVARRSEQIAIKLYNDLRPDYITDNLKDNITAIVHCAVLHDVLNVSACAFENVAEVTNVQIAAMVAMLSRDFRLVETKRDMEFRGRLSQSPLTAQIVAVARIICAAQSTVSLLDNEGMPAVTRAKKILGQMDGDLLAIHAAGKYYVLRLYTHAARGLLTDISQKIKACRQKAKMEKMVLQNTKTLRESVENSQAPKKPVIKKREKRCAKKRTIERDPE
jgi:hypothetical protein